MNPSFVSGSPSREWPPSIPLTRSRPGFGGASPLGDAEVAWARPESATHPATDSVTHRVCLSADGLVGLLDELDTGVLVCDARSQPLLFNEAARRELAEGGVLVLLTDGSLEVPGGSGLLALRQAVHAAACEHRQQLVLLRCGERTLMVAVQPLRSGPAEPPCAVLLLGRRSLCPALAMQRLGGLYDLTDAEKAVLSGLVAGQRVGTLAHERGVAVSTVRTQVASLRAKFGVRRQDDLTRLVAELPPMVSALRGGPAAAAPVTQLSQPAGAGGRAALHR